MTVTIRNEEAQRLIHELANATGESMTAAVTEAVRQRLAPVRRERSSELAERLLAIGRDAAGRLSDDVRIVDPDEYLFREHALAKATGEPLLFKGGDFRLTDVTPAL